MKEGIIAGSGVEALIARLHEDGVAAGAAEAERLLAVARAEAISITSRARADADRLLAEATVEAERRRKAGQSALALAVRDARIAAREALVDLFEGRLAALVGDSMADPALMKALIDRAAETLCSDGTVYVNIGLAPAIAECLIGHLAFDLATDGIRIAAAPGGPALQVYRTKAALRLELSEEALASVLMAQLRPVLHHLLDGDPDGGDG